MTAFHRMVDMEWSDEDKYDHAMAHEVEPPDYPPGLQFIISRDDLEKFCDASECQPGSSIRFAAMGVATSINRGMGECLIEVELTEMAGEDGQFAPLDNPAAISLCSPELERLDLDEECERGDTIHIIGTARVERTSSPRYGGDSVTLQIVEAAIEDESDENRDAA